MPRTSVSCRAKFILRSKAGSFGHVGKIPGYVQFVTSKFRTTDVCFCRSFLPLCVEISGFCTASTPLHLKVAEAARSRTHRPKSRVSGCDPTLTKAAGSDFFPKFTTCRCYEKDPGPKVLLLFAVISRCHGCTLQNRSKFCPNHINRDKIAPEAIDIKLLHPAFRLSIDQTEENIVFNYERIFRKLLDFRKFCALISGFSECFYTFLSIFIYFQVGNVLKVHYHACILIIHVDYVDNIFIKTSCLQLETKCVKISIQNI